MASLVSGSSTRAALLRARSLIRFAALRSANRPALLRVTSDTASIFPSRESSPVRLTSTPSAIVYPF
nr:MAG TPA: hypothetical protein [Caudoviricetes sp.]